ncbi:MAG TPA: IS21 family transposase, partial [Beutenbergiaceae bacterium]|nr:IS21 family transposase [Beutenbergiaceae bacterium]
VLIDGTKVAKHVRSIHKYTDTLQLDHYLEVLATKPGALPGSRTLAQARKAGVFTSVHQRFWDQVRIAHGDQQGTRMLIEVLLLHRTMNATSVLAGIQAAGRVGVLTPDVVAVEARRHEETRSPVVVDIGRPLPTDERALPSLGSYDVLLGVGA